jgi:GNAT superfamily N-acetyltransferase
MRATRTYLELRDPAALAPSHIERDGIRVDAIERCAPSFWRSLYQEVGGAYHWIDRLPWSDEEINAYLSDPDVSLWVLTVDGEVAGYFELCKTRSSAAREGNHDVSVEIAYFGLRPGFYGHGLGGYLLTVAVERAFVAGAQRVWVHTCTLDHPSALPNYLKRGFTIYRREEYEVTPI